MQKQIISDLEVLVTRLQELKVQFENNIVSGKTFAEVKTIHVQIKDLTRLIDQLEAEQQVEQLRREMTSDITLEILMLLRDFMTLEQLERYGDYLAHRVVEKPFTWEEIHKLRVLKEKR